MANKDTQNNVAGKPAMTGNFAKATGGQNTASFVAGAHSAAFSTGDFGHTGGGAQNADYGDRTKYPLTTAPEVALENNKDGGAISGGMKASISDRRARVK